MAHRAHEFGQPAGEFTIGVLALDLIEVHQHDWEIDAPSRRIGVFRLHNVLFAQDGGLVLQDQRAAAVPVLHHRAIDDEALARTQR